MRIGRAVIPAIITLGFMGSALMASAAGVVAAAHAPSAHPRTVASAQAPDVYYRG